MPTVTSAGSLNNVRLCEARKFIQASARLTRCQALVFKHTHRVAAAPGKFSRAVETVIQPVPLFGCGQGRFGGELVRPPGLEIMWVQV